MSEELKPCPFCGGEAELLGEKVFYAWCDKCETRGDYYNTEAEAIAAWNTRYHCGLTDEDYNILLDELGVSERTCKLTFGKDNLPECGNCGEALSYYTLRHGLAPKNRRSAYFCPQCGAKVVME